jgi:hypothetical protein
LAFCPSNCIFIVEFLIYFTLWREILLVCVTTVQNKLVY